MKTSSARKRFLQPFINDIVEYLEETYVNKLTHFDLMLLMSSVNTKKGTPLSKLVVSISPSCWRIDFSNDTRVEFIPSGPTARERSSILHCEIQLSVEAAHQRDHYVLRDSGYKDRQDFIRDCLQQTANLIKED